MPKNPSRTTALIYLVLLVAIAVLAWSIFQSNRLNASAEAMALNVVQDTFSQDYPEQLLLNSHPNFQREFPEDQLVRYLNGINLRAGPLESLVSISGGSNVPLIGWSRGLKSASYEVELQFRNSRADVQVDLRLAEGSWLITRFDLFADMLAN